MKKYWILMIVLALAMALGVAFACAKKSGDDDDSSGDDVFDDDADDDIFDDDTSDDSGDDTDCATNVAPELLAAYYIVNGSQVTPPVTVHPEDLFGVYFEYNDDDCNLPGGQFWANLNDAGYEAFPDPLPADLGCSTAQSGLIYGFSMQNPMTEGTDTFAVYWTDVCDAQSNEITGGWTVAAK